MTRRGYTIIELLMVMIVIGILAALGILRYIDLRQHAEVASIVSDLNNVRLGAYNYWADKNAFPPDAAPGLMPAGMEPYMRAGFRFDDSNYTLDWENFQGPGGSSGGGGMQVGVVVTAPSSHLLDLLARRTGGSLPFFISGSSVTFILVGPDGAM
ncbi:MAG TPA: type II secretion system protein [Gemmatimonadales bacterium]|nr:type II secretion system protein [Gemmatimonadales bacterium]